MAKRLLAMGIATSLLALAPGRGAEAGAAKDHPSPRVIRGAESSTPVRPQVFEGDLRDLGRTREWAPGEAVRIVPRRVYPRPDAQGRLAPAAEPEAGPSWPDPLLQPLDGTASEDRAYGTPDQNFDAFAFTGAFPPDPVGDVGASHYITAVNGSGTSFRIYDKAGTLLAGPTTLHTLWTASGGSPTSPCTSGLGDPIVLYDTLVGRWLISEFSQLSGRTLCVYVSRTADPVAGGWYAYAFQAPNFPDYPKYAVWPDAYYVGTNESGNSPLYALDRTNMLAGNAASFQRLTVPSELSGFGFQLLLPADLDGTTAPPVGAPAVFMRHKDEEVHGGPTDATRDTLELYELRVNFTTPANTTLTGPISLDVAEFSSELCGLSSFECVPQPGTARLLDPLREPLMWRVQYRNFTTHETLLATHVTDAGDFTDHHAVRFYELRRTPPGTGSWSVFQQGTYAPDNTHRWMSSAAMDASGNIAVAYSVSNAVTGVFPGLRYTGRLAGDPAGTLPQGEYSIVEGGGAQTAAERWGDYSALGVDPVDGCRFWYTNEYVPAGSTQWRTRVASFRFASCGVAPGTPLLAVNDPTVSEAAASATFTVTLTPAATSTVTVQYATADGSASAGSDYTSRSGTLTFTPGTTSATVAVPLLGDPLDEPDESFRLDLSNATGGAVLSDERGIATITDDDPAPAIAIADAALDEGDTGTTNASFAVTLSSPSASAVTVAYSTADGTATDGRNEFDNTDPIDILDAAEADPYPASIDVPAVTGTVSSVSVTLHGLAHTYSDDVDVLLVGPTGTAVMLFSDAGGDSSVSGLDLTFDDGAASEAPDDAPLVAGTFKPTDHDAGNDTFPAPAPSGPYGTSLSAFSGQNPAGTWSLYVLDDEAPDAGSLAGGWTLTLRLGGDYQAASGTLTFSPGTTSASVPVAVNGDTSVEPDETFTVNLSSPTNATLADTQGLGTIRNDDAARVTSSRTVAFVGETVTATVAGASGNVYDWVGLYATDAADASGPIDWFYLNGQRTPPARAIVSAALSFPMSRTGTLHFRLFSGNGFTRIATSGTIAVSAPTTPPSLSMSATSPRPGQTVEVTVSGGPGGRLDWVGLVPVGADSRALVDWRYLNNLKVAPRVGTSSATVSFAILAPGEYEFRFFPDDSFQALSTSGRITVLASPGPVLEVRPGSVSFGSVTTGVGAERLLVVRNAGGGLLDGTTLVSGTGFSLATPADYSLGPGESTEMIVVLDPTTDGSYAGSLVFDDGATPVTVPLSGTAVSESTVVADTTLAAPGQTVVVNVAGGPADRRDWVALAAVGSNNDQVLDWFYLNGTKVPPSAGLSSAILEFRMPVPRPVPVGAYEFRFFNADTLARLATSQPVGLVPPSVTVSKTTAARGETILVTVANGPGTATDWLGLYEGQDYDDVHFLSWTYLNGSQTAGAGVRSAQLEVKLPSTAGYYNLRLFYRGSFERIGVSVMVRVQ